jgi:hypothetical protein
VLYRLAVVAVLASCGPSAARLDAGADRALETHAVDTRREGAVDRPSLETPPDRPPSDLGPVSEWDRVLATGVTVGEVVSRFAPVIYQDTDTGGPDNLGAKQDYPCRVDFDGDLQHNNNWENLVTKPLDAYIYYGLVATTTHYFLTFSPYHARDWEKVCSGLLTECHEGDMEHVVVVVRHDGAGLGKPIALLTEAHNRIWVWSNPGDGVSSGPKNVSGKIDFEDDQGGYSPVATTTHTHVRVYAQERAHGPIACRAVENTPFPFWYGFLEGIHCERGSTADAGFFNGDGITLRFRRSLAAPYLSSWNGAKLAATYDVVGVLDSLFAWRGLIGKDKVYRSDDTVLYLGGRGAPFAFAQPIGGKFDVQQFVNDGGSGVPPWAMQLTGSARGDLFLDPAYAVKQALVLDHPLSLTYTYNPFVPGSVAP